MRFRLSMSLLLATGLSACAPAGDDGVLAAPDEAVFNTQTYDVLLRDCGFVECHGREGRFLRVFGPGRARLYEIDYSDPTAEGRRQMDEKLASYRSARAVIYPDRPEESDLLRKPLDVAAGGAGHKGTDVYGRDVYPDRDDPNFMILEAFAKSAAAGDSP